MAAPVHLQPRSPQSTAVGLCKCVPRQVARPWTWSLPLCRHATGTSSPHTHTHTRTEFTYSRFASPHPPPGRRVEAVETGGAFATRTPLHRAFAATGATSRRHVTSPGASDAAQRPATQAGRPVAPRPRPSPAPPLPRRTGFARLGAMAQPPPSPLRRPSTGGVGLRAGASGVLPTNATSPSNSLATSGLQTMPRAGPRTRTSRPRGGVALVL